MLFVYILVIYINKNISKHTLFGFKLRLKSVALGLNANFVEKNQRLQDFGSTLFTCLQQLVLWSQSSHSGI